MSKKILITGDLVWDTHIARLPVTGLGYFETHSHTQLVNRLGGAWYLRDVIQALIKAQNATMAKHISPDQTHTRESLAAEVFCPEPVEHSLVEGENCPSGIAKGFSIWKFFDGAKKTASAKILKGKKQDEEPTIIFKWPKGPAEPGTWRITEFLGCQAAVWNSKRPCPVVNNEPANPDVLVIDDLGLGFANHEECWPKCLREPQNFSGAIVVKGTPPFTSALWQKLLNPNLKLVENLTVVISVAAMRDMGATIARGLSWDRAIEDFQREYSQAGCVSMLRHCRRVVVTCGRSGAAVFSRCPRSPMEEDTKPSVLQFERFVFDPKYLEDTWSLQYEGITFGTGSLMTAALVGRELAGEKCQPSTHLTVSQGLLATRKMHQGGAGHDPDGFKVDEAETTVFSMDSNEKPSSSFRSAFPRDLLDSPILTAKSESESLLTDAVGSGRAFLMATAENIVRFGQEQYLADVPRLECGKYFTVDREEIENLNTVKNLIEEYRTGSDPRPLSIAVFGAPGSGKSFAIKQLAEAAFGEQRSPLENNLSQFRGLDDLHEAFHEVRDRSVQRQIPLVFWDEFDCKRNDLPLGWLQEFLAPMQDANFQANGKTHPFGKCIFIFAGGTKTTFKDFDRSGDEQDEDFRKVKGPDFVSRLRGFVNIKGPNPSGGQADEVSIIRRGILLRALIERHHPQAIHPESKELIIHPRVLAAFLGVEKYRHGSRSMEAIVSLCHLHGTPHLGPSELPPQEVIHLHVSKDFGEKLSGADYYHLLPSDVEKLAEIKHKNWWDGKAAQGYVLGDKRNDNSNPKTHPLCKPYNQLNGAGKEGNRLPARLAVLRLESLGYRIVRTDQVNGNAVTEVDEKEILKMAQSEHRRWMREKLINGWAYGACTSDDLLLHGDICKFPQLQKPEQKLDHEIIKAIFAFLTEKGLVLVKPSKGE